jgi:4-hydroxybenzoate polyprenyltransferase
MRVHGIFTGGVYSMEQREEAIPPYKVIRELIVFTRPETCLFISGIGISGYLIFSPPGTLLLPLFLSIYFLSAASYAYNYLTDKDEDTMNGVSPNLFVSNGKGPWVIGFLILLAALSSVLLPRVSFGLIMLIIPLSIIYSRYRVKKVFLLKNIYTGLTIAVIFLIGAAAAHPLSMEVLRLFPLVFAFGFVLNVCGDIRGYGGDRVSGVKTIPVLYGIGWAKWTVYTVLALFVIGVVSLGLVPFYPLVLPAILISFFLRQDDMKKTRYSILLSFTVLPILLLLQS